MRLFNAEHPPIPWPGVCWQQVNGRWEADAHWGYRHIIEEGRHKRLTQALALLNVAAWGITGRTLWRWEGILYQLEQWFKKMVEAQAKEHPKVALTFGGFAVFWFILLTIGHLLVGNWWWSAVDVIVVAFYGSLARLAYGCLRYPRIEVTAATDHESIERQLDALWVQQQPCEALTVDMLRQAARRLHPATTVVPEDIAQVAATQRAWNTLYSYLSNAERVQLDNHGYFEMPSKLTPGRIYRIPRLDGVVPVLDNGQQVMTICTRPEDAGIPWPDVMLAYKLGLQADEERWLETANKWPIITGQVGIAEGGTIDWNTVRFIEPPVIPDITAQTPPNEVNVTLHPEGFATVTIPHSTSFSANFNWAGDSLDVTNVFIAGERMPLVLNEVEARD